MTRFQAHRVRYTVRPRSMVADRRSWARTTDRAMSALGLVAALAAEIWFPIRLVGFMGAVAFWVAQIVVIVLLVRAVPR